MTKEKLIQYCDLKQEIDKLEKRIDRLEKQSDFVSDVVQNGYKHHAVITGYDCNRAYRLDLLKLTLRERYDKALETQTEIETWINTIQRSDLRQIFEHRYIDGMNWIQIGYIMKSTSDAVRIKHDRFLEKI